MWWVKNENIQPCGRVFYKRNLTDSRIDRIVWSLKEYIKEYIRQMHTKANGGQQYSEQESNRSLGTAVEKQKIYNDTLVSEDEFSRKEEELQVR
ncbi:hypothetical protein BDV27DRAFT_126647 [Aspergillus caelatus]|uniref:Uncharacterized protein n=1 Tax=Aspergillus caelatus TaxID=61420 RepID=A0A5N7A6X5_9EURO|nr:uncharacterized protein BDV27DRAFT_126647 [Aspergillus caelatus]KAE8365594.1 hypothetical protein BDV27DRAFT_126647 [Aspergillus caelatus]